MIGKLKIILFLITLTLSNGQGYSQNWIPVGEGLMCFSQPYDLVYDIAVDTLTGNIYARGQILSNGYCDSIRTVACWNGDMWIPLGPPLGHTIGWSVGIYQNQVYASGNWWGLNPFNPVDNILAQWSGTFWDSIPGAPPYVFLIEEHQGDLYLGGGFDTCANFQTKLLTRYHNGEWEKIVPHFDDLSYGLAMTFYKDTLYVGGQFDADSDFGEGINDIAKVYDTELHSVGQGLNGASIVEAMITYNDTLFIGGSFSQGNFDTGEHSYLITYSNGKLEPYPIQPDGRVVAMKVYDNAVYLAGWFRNFGDSASCHVVKLKNGIIEVLNRDTLFLANGNPSSLTGTIRDIEIYNDTLYLAGAFYAIGQDTALNCIAKLNRSLGGMVGINTPLSAENDFRIYPNPSDILSIELKLASHSPVQFEIYDVTGRMVASWKETLAAGTHNKEYSYADLPSATYVVRVVTGAEKMVTKRWVKLE